MFVIDDTFAGCLPIIITFILHLIIIFLFPVELGSSLERAITNTWPDGIVRLIRAETRSGLIRARMIGARAATASVLCWLDAHVEVSRGW